MMAMSNPVQNAGEASLFASCPPSEREALRLMAVPLRVAAGEVIVGQGDFGATIGVLLAGRASVWVGDEHVADLGPGDTYGELAVLSAPGSHGRRSARIRAETEVRVDTITKRDLAASLNDIPTIAEMLRQQAARYDG